MSQNETDCKRLQPLISGALDDELTQQQSQHLQHHLKSCDRCKKTYQELEQMQKQLRQGRPASTMPPSAAESTKEGMWHVIGWLLMLLGVLPLVGYVSYQILADEQLPSWVKLSIGSIGMGLLILFIYVARQRFIAAKTDNYKKVQL
ncbi:hypothetical protein PSI9734_00603 [Pseudidiomarina piscicola]|uniref:Putative zinc-finger domain-containing protein n=1 Tax=Pseudidiomarina piscicola TaxID=2614830 RepID=A0A6Y9WJJ2_9GAMM|nr:zf-HC2 domain-containing protein [Pseudidiomarina piscicola]CAB0150031.1 hypothetical protein PSI9734_00603 [Pseudidiomarina piscicola]VZT39476.1 hypothetical protein PSI9734_00603 [Pseudomonas aeruginosa]